MLRKLVVAVAAAATLCGIPHMVDAAAHGPECIKSVDRAIGVAYSKCYKIEPWKKQRIRVKLWNLATDTWAIRKGQWVTEDGGKSIVIWWPSHYVFFRASVIVVYA